MRFYGDMTQAQIGHKLGISQMHVSRLLAHALGYLRSRLLGQPDRPAAPATRNGLERLLLRPLTGLPNTYDVQGPAGSVGDDDEGAAAG
jgi:hypothetical protein